MRVFITLTFSVPIMCRQGITALVVLPYVSERLFSFPGALTLSALDLTRATQFNVKAFQFYV